MDEGNQRDLLGEMKMRGGEMNYPKAGKLLGQLLFGDERLTEITLEFLESLARAVQYLQPFAVYSGFC